MQNGKNLCVSDHVPFCMILTWISADSDKYFSGCCGFICKPKNMFMMARSYIVLNILTLVFFQWSDSEASS